MQTRLVMTPMLSNLIPSKNDLNHVDIYASRVHCRQMRCFFLKLQTNGRRQAFECDYLMLLGLEKFFCMSINILEKKFSQKRRRKFIDRRRRMLPQNIKGGAQFIRNRGVHLEIGGDATLEYKRRRIVHQKWRHTPPIIFGCIYSERVQPSIFSLACPRILNP